MNKIGAYAGDRELGEYWEDRFCEIAQGYGWEAWPFQRQRGATFYFEGKSYICPDVWLLRRGEYQYICEIKHKNAARNGCYGFEQYRQESMLALEREYCDQFGIVTALYVVHDHDLAGGKFSKINNIEHWRARQLILLADIARRGMSKTLYGGAVTKNEVEINYYPKEAFVRVVDFLGIPQYSYSQRYASFHSEPTPTMRSTQYCETTQTGFMYFSMPDD